MLPSAAGGVTPTLSADQLLASTPQLAEVAQLEATTLATLPGASLQPSHVLDAVAWARSAVESGADGVVLVQGTDTMEETAYLADLAWDLDAPLVVSGAMRSPSAPGADGPANLVAAVRTAGSAAARGLGALVVMDDEVHAAARVRKTASSTVQAFASPSFGPLGRVSEGSVVVAGRPGRWPALRAARPGADPRVVLLETHLGDRGELLDLVVDAGCDAVVVAAFGVGHVPAGLADSIEAATARVPVVLASRTGSGTTFRSTYGFPGSESDLIARGAVPAGWLDPRKARVLVWYLLAAGYEGEELAERVRVRGAAPGGPAGPAR
jgi:L-asparaginase